MNQAIVRKWLVRGAAAAVALTCQAFLSTGVAWSQNQPFVNAPGNATLEQYFDTTTGDNFVRTLNSADFPVCAMMYVYDAHERLQTCCGCQLTGDGPDFQTVNAHLTANSSSGTPPATGVIKILSTLPNTPSTANPPPLPQNNDNTVCDPTKPASLVAALRPWILHNPAEPPTGGGSNVASLTEPAFESVPLAVADLQPNTPNSVLNRCKFIQNHQSGKGICSCGLQDNTLNAAD